MANADGDTEQLEVLELLKHFEGRLKVDSLEPIAFLQNRPSEKKRGLEPVKELLTLFQKADNDRKEKEQRAKGDCTRVNLSDCLDWNEVHEQGHELWTNLMRAAIADIDPNAKGHSALLKYLTAATEFEDLLYGLEPFYRDHTLHSLWVYLIGVKLMSKEGELKEIAQNLNWYVYNDVREKEQPVAFVAWARLEEIRLNAEIQKKRDAIWCIMALCHDLGYSLAKLSELNKKVQAVLEFYDVSNFRHVGYTLDLEHQYLITQCLELMAMDVRITPGTGYEKEPENGVEGQLINRIEKIEEEVKKKIESCEELEDLQRDTMRLRLMQEVESDDDTLKDFAKEVYDNVLTKCFRDDSSYWRLCKAFEGKEHGVLSAYLLFKTMGLFADVSVRAPAEGWGLDDDEAVDNIIRGDILFAIAQHEFAFAHIDHMSSLAEILILCDELEEFSRLGRQLLSRKYHDTTAETGVKVTIVPKGVKDPCKAKVKIAMTYDSRHEDLKEFIKFCCRKAGRLCKLFSLVPDKSANKEEKAYQINEIETTFNYNDKPGDAGSEMGHVAVFSMKDNGDLAVTVRTPNGTKEAALECRDDDIYIRDNGTDTDLEAWLRGKECFNIKDEPATIAKVMSSMPYGHELILDLHGCDATTFSRESIDAYFETLCDAIDMVGCERYWWDDVGVSPEEQQTLPHTKGTSAIQFILTSSIVIHTLDMLDAAYVNIFSCKEFDPATAKRISVEWFKAKTCREHFIERI